MTLRTRVKALVVALFLAVGSAVGLHALRPYSSYFHYYSDATLTEQVGAGFIDCHWYFWMIWGEETPYYTEERDPCDPKK